MRARVGDEDVSASERGRTGSKDAADRTGWRRVEAIDDALRRHRAVEVQARCEGRVVDRRDQIGDEPDTDLCLRWSMSENFDGVVAAIQGLRERVHLIVVDLDIVEKIVVEGAPVQLPEIAELVFRETG